MTDLSQPFESLLLLQEEDLHKDQLRHRIEHHPTMALIKALHEQSVGIDRSTVQIRLEHAEYSNRQQLIEREVVDIDRRIGEIDDRLRNDASGSFRDQTAMSNEMNALVTRKRLLEDEELELMESLEPLDLQLESVRSDQADLHDRALVLQREMASEQEQLKVELAGVLAKRDVLASQVVPSLLAEYEKLRSHLGGIGAARLVHGICSGCNLALSATEIGRLGKAEPTAIVHCEQCGRILIP